MAPSLDVLLAQILHSSGLAYLLWLAAGKAGRLDPEDGRQVGTQLQQVVRAGVPFVQVRQVHQPLWITPRGVERSGNVLVLP